MSCTRRWVRVSASVWARRSSSWLTSLTTRRATTRSISRTTEAAAIATSASTMPLPAMPTASTCAWRCKIASSTNETAAVAEMTRTRRDSAEKPTSSA